MFAIVIISAAASLPPLTAKAHQRHMTTSKSL
jgi:hypothetical protein